MSTNYHTPIPTGSAANAATFNAPLSELDSALTAFATGEQPLEKLVFNAASTLTISTGTITPTASLHLVSSETGTSDTLSTITPLNNTLLFLKATSGHTILLTNSGNITTKNVTLSGNSVIGLFCHNAKWGLINQPLTDKLSNRLFCSGLELTSSSVTNSVAVSAGECASDNNHAIISLPSGTTIDMTASGINGIDTGSIAASTWYYIWVCSGASGSGAVASISNSSPTLPAGYNIYKRLIGTVITDTTPAVRSQAMVRGEANARKVYYTNSDNGAPFQILNQANIGTSGARTQVDCSALVPPTSDNVLALVATITPGAAYSAFWSIGDGNDSYILTGASTSQITYTTMTLRLVLGTSIGEVYSDTATTEDFSFWVQGYIDSVLGRLPYTPT